MKRIAYIDMQNIKMGCKEAGRDIDRQKLYIYLNQKYRLDEIGIYVGFRKEYIGFYQELKTYGYIVYFKSTHQRDGKQKGNIDTLLTQIATQHIERQQISFGLLISGDGDFDVIVKERKKHAIGFFWIFSLRKKIGTLIVENTEPYQRICLEDRKNHIQKNHQIHDLAGDSTSNYKIG